MRSHLFFFAASMMRLPGAMLAEVEPFVGHAAPLGGLLDEGRDASAPPSCACASNSSSDIRLGGMYSLYISTR